MDDAFELRLLEKLPLAQGVFHLFSYALDGPFLEGLFEAHRGRCYKRVLSFPQLVYLVRDALMCDGSGHRAMARAAEAGAMPVAKQNAYGKLKRVPLGLTCAFLADGAARVRTLLPPEATRAPLPASLAALACVAVDGKKLKNVAKRLKALRGRPGKVLGAKLLVGLEMSTGLAVAMSVHPDGERNDVPLVPDLLPQVRAKLGAAVLWVADAQFCDLNLPVMFTAEGGHFLLRYTRKLSFHPDPSRPAREGVDARGRELVEEWGWVRSEKDDRRRYVRRVTLYRPGEEEVAVITDLLDPALYPAADLLEAYLMRWGIERVFQQVTEVFALQSLIGTSPNATAFQAAFCLLVYDMVQVAKAYAARAGGVRPEAVSGENLFDDVKRQLTAWAVAAKPDHLAAYLTTPPPADALREMLGRWIGGSWTPRWIKAVNKNPRKPSDKPRRSGAHTSVWRALQAHRLAVQQKPRS